MLWLCCGNGSRWMRDARKSVRTPTPCDHVEFSTRKILLKFLNPLPIVCGHMKNSVLWLLADGVTCQQTSGELCTGVLFASSKLLPRAHSHHSTRGEIPTAALDMPTRSCKPSYTGRTSARASAIPTAASVAYSHRRFCS